MGDENQYAGRPSAYFVNLWVTRRCNFRCRYCYEKHKYRNQDLDHETADRVLSFVRRDITPAQELVVNFHGGEPLLNFETMRYVVESIRETLQNPVSFGVTTNGSLLTNEIADYLAENFDMGVSVSLDGKEETHRRNRICVDGTYSYDDIMQKALRLRAKGVFTRIRMTYDRYNAPLLFENIRHFIDLGFETIVPVPDFYAKDWTEDDFETVKGQYRLVRDYIKEKGLSIEIEPASDCLRELGRCTAGHDYYSVDVDGAIYPCTDLVGDKTFLIGDVSHGIDLQALAKVDAVNAQPVTECAGCQAYHYCQSARCLLSNYATTGDFYSPNLVHCNLLGIKLDLIGELSHA